MNTLIESIIDNMEKQLVGYQYLLTYRYHNLCVDQQPGGDKYGHSHRTS